VPRRELDEETSTLVYGPIDKQRWIYASSKQLLDRVIYAYGVRDGVDYTLFRPFNWIGPKLDNVFEPKEGSSRLFTQFISNVIFKKPIQLVDGGKQSRSFTFIDDGVDALLRIIENKDGCASRQIFNIGNPEQRERRPARQADHRRLQALSRNTASTPNRRRSSSCPPASISANITRTSRSACPRSRNIKKQLGWKPKVDLKTAIKLTLDYHLAHKDYWSELE
jgi:nucleoside-diphosphate-sugar epimerase